MGDINKKIRIQIQGAIIDQLHLCSILLFKREMPCLYHGKHYEWKANTQNKKLLTLRLLQVSDFMLNVFQKMQQKKTNQNQQQQNQNQKPYTHAQKKGIAERNVFRL